MKITHVDFDSLLSKTASVETIIDALKSDETPIPTKSITKQAEDHYEDKPKNEDVKDALILGAGGAGAISIKGALDAKKAKKKFKAEHAKSTMSKIKGYGDSVMDAVKMKGGPASKQLAKMKSASRNTKIGAAVAGAAGVGALINDEKTAEEISTSEAALVAGAGAAGGQGLHALRSKQMSKKYMGTASKIGAGVGASIGALGGMPVGLATGAAGGVIGSEAGERVMRGINKRKISKAATKNRLIGGTVAAGTTLGALLAGKKTKKEEITSEKEAPDTEDKIEDITKNASLILAFSGLEKIAKATQEDINKASREVQEESTPSGGAKKRAKEGAGIGALGGFMYGASKKSPVKGMRIARGIWHGAAGASLTGSAAGASTFVKKSLSSDTEMDKQRAFERKIEKVASAINNVGKINPLNLSILLAG